MDKSIFDGPLMVRQCSNIVSSTSSFLVNLYGGVGIGKTSLASQIFTASTCGYKLYFNFRQPIIYDGDVKTYLDFNLFIDRLWQKLQSTANFPISSCVDTKVLQVIEYLCLKTQYLLILDGIDCFFYRQDILDRRFTSFLVNLAKFAKSMKTHVYLLTRQPVSLPQLQGDIFYLPGSVFNPVELQLFFMQRGFCMPTITLAQELLEISQGNLFNILWFLRIIQSYGYNDVESYLKASQALPNYFLEKHYILLESAFDDLFLAEYYYSTEPIKM